MKRLGYTRYVAQGGDWGAQITDVMGAEAPPELLGIHSNMPGTVPPDLFKMVSAGEPARQGSQPRRTARTSDLLFLYTKGIGYATRCRCTPRRCTGWRTRRSRWRRG